MSEITINQKNISRFTKRLRKSLGEKFGQAVSLNMASLILAETFGVDTIHNLQKKLGEVGENKKGKEPNNVDVIDKYIRDYFNENRESKILSFDFGKDWEHKSFNLTAFTKKYNDRESFGIFFGHECKSMDLSSYILSNGDIEFIQNLIKLLNFDSMPENIYIGEKLAVKCGLVKEGCSYYEYRGHDNFKDVCNYGYCERFFVIVGDDYFERVGAPYELSNEYYSFFNLENERSRFFTLIDDAIENLKGGEMILEFLTPLEQSSTLVKKSEYKKQGLGTFFIYVDESGNKVGKTVNGGQQSEVTDVKSFYKFLGKCYFNMRLSRDNLNLAINFPYLNEVLMGYDDARNVPVKKGGAKKTK